MEQPLILVTCDDGIESPGLRAAVEAVLDLGRVLVSASHEQQSSTGRSYPSINDGAIHPIDYRALGQQVEAYAIRGSPAQAVLYALVELVPRRPDLCLSGINFGENPGTSVTSSGTVGAALEAADGGVPALAVGLEVDKELHFRHSHDVDFSTASLFARTFTVQMLSAPMPPDVDVLKVDVPCDATPETPWRVTRQSRQPYYLVLPSGRSRLDEKRRLDYKIDYHLETLEPDSDIHALAVERLVSVTPLSLDLTSRVGLQTLEAYLRSKP